jgi:hypothetical protein
MLTLLGWQAILGCSTTSAPRAHAWVEAAWAQHIEPTYKSLKAVATRHLALTPAQALAAIHAVLADGSSAAATLWTLWIAPVWSRLDPNGRATDIIAAGWMRTKAALALAAPHLAAATLPVRKARVDGSMALWEVVCWMWLMLDADDNDDATKKLGEKEVEDNDDAFEKLGEAVEVDEGSGDGAEQQGLHTASLVLRFSAGEDSLFEDAVGVFSVLLGMAGILLMMWVFTQIDR